MLPHIFRIFSHRKESLFRDYGIIVGTKAIAVKAEKPEV